MGNKIVIEIENVRRILQGRNSLKIQILQKIEELTKEVISEYCCHEDQILTQRAKIRTLCYYKKELLDDLKLNREWEEYISWAPERVKFIYDIEDGYVYEDDDSLRQLYRDDYRGWVYRLKLLHMDEKKEMDRLEMFEEISERERAIEEAGEVEVREHRNKEEESKTVNLAFDFNDIDDECFDIQEKSCDIETSDDELELVHSANNDLDMHQFKDAEGTIYVWNVLENYYDIEERRSIIPENYHSEKLTDNMVIVMSEIITRLQNDNEVCITGNVIEQLAERIPFKKNVDTSFIDRKLSKLFLDFVDGKLDHFYSWRRVMKMDDDEKLSHIRIKRQDEDVLYQGQNEWMKTASLPDFDRKVFRSYYATLFYGLKDMKTVSFTVGAFMKKYQITSYYYGDDKLFERNILSRSLLELKEKFDCGIIECYFEVVNKEKGYEYSTKEFNYKYTLERFDRVDNTTEKSEAENNKKSIPW